MKKENPVLKLRCILPCEGQVDKVVYVSWKYREGCMLKRNRYLVDHAACLLAVYNGERQGGTAMTVRYARKVGREVIILNPV